MNPETLTNNKIIIESIVYKGEQRIKLAFDYDLQLIEKVKKIPGRLWSQTMKFWHVPNNNYSISSLKKIGISVNNITKNKEVAENKTFEKKILNKVNEKLYNDFIKYLKWKRLSENTIRSYSEAILKFLLFFNDKSPEQISNNDINEYIYQIVEFGYSNSFQNIALSSIKMFYAKTINRNIELDKLERPRRQRPLPKVISKEDIEKLLAGITNLKHKTALLLIYSLGLRRSELINLELKDIDSKQFIINIRNAKGMKDRTLPVSPKLMEKIKIYYRMFKPVKYLFEGQYEGQPYSEVSLQKVFHVNMDKIRPKNKFTLHCLRHSYATHLLENGTDIRYIQELLGHKSTRTTEIYTHVSLKNLRNIKSPSDEFNI